MRPDLEDYDELHPNAEAPRSRAMSWLVLAVAVGGFAALAYYAYHSGTKGTDGSEMLVVQADNTPIKQAPTDAGGEDFANKDKTIYDVINPQNGAAPKTEKLLPDPEKPLDVSHETHDARDMEDTTSEDAAPVAAAPAPAQAAATPPAPPANTTTFVNKTLTGAAPAADPVDAASTKQPVTTALPTVNAAVPVKKTESTATPPQAAITVSEVKTAGPTFVNEPTVGAKKAATTTTAAKKPAAKDTVKPATKPAAKPAVAAKGGAYSLQLGAFKSEDEAKAQWKKITAKFSGTISGSPTIVKADLPNGTFYRLRAGGFASSDAAKAACTKLSAASQACFPVK